MQIDEFERVLLGHGAVIDSMVIERGPSVSERGGTIMLDLRTPEAQREVDAAVRFLEDSRPGESREQVQRLVDTVVVPAAARIRAMDSRFDMVRAAELSAATNTWFYAANLRMYWAACGDSRAMEAEAQAAEAQSSSDLEAEVARELAELEAAIALAEAEARALEAEARAAEISEAAESAVAEAESVAQNIVRDPSLRSAFHRRSWGRTGAGLGLIAAGAMLALKVACSPTGSELVRDPRATSNTRYEYFFFTAVDVRVSNSTDWLWSQCKNTPVSYQMGVMNNGRMWENRWSLSEIQSHFARHGASVDESDFFPYGKAYFEASADGAMRKLFLGFGMIGVGTLLATIWADVPDVDLAASITPGGGVLLSRSFGW